MDNSSTLYQKELDAEKEKIINMLENIIENQSEYSYITLASEISAIYEYTNETFKTTILKAQIAKFFEEKDKKINDILGNNYE